MFWNIYFNMLNIFKTIYEILKYLIIFPLKNSIELILEWFSIFVLIANLLVMSNRLPAMKIYPKNTREFSCGITEVETFACIFATHSLT